MNEKTSTGNFSEMTHQATLFAGDNPILMMVMVVVIAIVAYVNLPKGTRETINGWLQPTIERTYLSAVVMP